MRKILLSAIALLALSAQNAFAINLTFQFDVNSSGPSMYACNAGIKHGPAKTGNVCYDKVTLKSCNVGCAAGNINECADKYEAPKNCVCTGEYYPEGTQGAQGTYRMDFLQATTTDWADNQQTTTSGEQNHLLGADKQSTGKFFNQIFGTDADDGIGKDASKDVFAKQISKMSVNLGSEVYGAEYFVDICYRGPQIDYKHDDTYVNGLNFNLKAHATIFDIKDADGKKYNELAKLEVKAEAKCIIEDDFNYCLADLLPGQTAGCGKSVTKTFNYDFSKGFAPITNGATVSKLIEEGAIAADGNKTPRFCQVRYTFKETSTEMRKWKSQRARICTYTEITEPSN